MARIRSSTEDDDDRTGVELRRARALACFGDAVLDGATCFGGVDFATRDSFLVLFAELSISLGFFAELPVGCNLRTEAEAPVFLEAELDELCACTSFDFGAG